jgi:superfamily II DNA or RNA helicase
VTDQITFAGGRMRVGFDDYGIESYHRFLRAKTLPEYEVEFDALTENYTITAPERFARMMGVELPAQDRGELPLSEFLFDDQAAVVKMAIEAMRFAIWTDCGWGKTLAGLEWAKHVVHRTRGRVLIFTRNEIIGQWIDTAREFHADGLPLVHLGTREKMKAWAKGDMGPGVAITNYEKMNYAHEGTAGQVVREFGHLSGVVLDEGSRLRTAGGRQKWALIKSCEQIPYRLILTATPAPNDVAEFMSQAGFLGKFRAEQSINAYFSRNDKTHRWTVKPHARAAFFAFMASWSIYIRDPRRYGWRQNFADVPEPIIKRHDIEATDEQRDLMRTVLADGSGRRHLFASQETNTIQRARLSQLAKGFLYVRDRKDKKAREVRLVESRKPAFVADLIRAEVKRGLQVLVWTSFDAESDILARLLGESVEFELMTGKTKKRERVDILERFRTGQSRVLISLPAMLGFGMNFQHVGSMIFSGFNDSYESWYQAIRRAYRYGQRRRLRVHVPLIPELEEDMYENIMRKQRDDEANVLDMESHYIRAMAAAGQLPGTVACAV